MNRIYTRRLLTALGVSVALAIGVSSISSAQPAPRPLPGNPSYNQDRAAPPDRRDGTQYDRRQDRLERRLDYLHSQLRITPAQQRLWDDFASAVRETSEGVADQRPGFDRDRDYRGRPDDRADRYGRDYDRRDAPSILNRLERRQDVLAQQSDRLNRLVTTLRPLYDSLSTDQKRVADRELFQPRAGDYGRGRFTQFDGYNDRPYYDREYR